MSTHDHPFHLLHYDVKDKKDLMWHTFFKMIGAHLFSVFIPAILYFQLGLSLPQVFLFFGLHSLLALLFQRNISTKFIARTGAKLSMIIGVLGFSAYMILLMLANTVPRVIFLAPLFSAIHTSFFRIAFHYNMSIHRRKEKHMGSQLSRIEIAKTIAAAAGPVLGGMITDARGVVFLLGSALLLVVLSIVPLFNTAKKHVPQKFSPKKYAKLILRDRKLIKYIVATFSSIAYVQYVATVLRSITLFAFFQSYTKMGIVSTIATILVVMLLYLIGRISDDDDATAQKIVLWSSKIQGITWLSAGILLFGGILSQLLYGVIDMMHKLTYIINHTYLTKRFYDHAGTVYEKNPLYLVLIRESSIHGAKIIFCLAFTMLFWVIGDSISYLALPFILVVGSIPLQLMLMKYGKK